MTRKPLRRRVEKLRAETRKIVELPERPISATCVRVPVVVSHAEAVWVESEEPLSVEEARNLLGHAPGIRLQRNRRDPTVANGLVFFVAADNLRRGAALNAIQIAETPAGTGGRARR